jgi:ubiquinone/menaquinone biosynthesis C-methylase UbiE
MSKVKKHFDKIAGDYDIYKKKNAFYYSSLKNLLKKYIKSNTSVFEIGCGTGELLYYLKPRFGYGMDLSPKMIEIAKQKYKSENNLSFSTVWPNKRFDYIFMSDVIEHLEKPQTTFSKISKIMGPKTVFINTMANPIWEPILILAEKMGFKMPEGPHNRISFQEIKKTLLKEDIKIVAHGYKLLIPIKIMFITEFANRFLEKHFKKLAFIEYFVAKKQ